MAGKKKGNWRRQEMLFWKTRKHSVLPNKVELFYQCLFMAIIHPSIKRKGFPQLPNLLVTPKGRGEVCSWEPKPKAHRQGKGWALMRLSRASPPSRLCGTSKGPLCNKVNMNQRPAPCRLSFRTIAWESPKTTGLQKRRYQRKDWPTTNSYSKQ